MSMTGAAQWLAASYRNKRVLITGHTGFKGSWVKFWLEAMLANTCGVALPPTSPLSAFAANRLGERNSHFVDVRDRAKLSAVFDSFDPEIVFHLAAQAIVGEGFENP